MPPCGLRPRAPPNPLSAHTPTSGLLCVTRSSGPSGKHLPSNIDLPTCAGTARQQHPRHSSVGRDIFCVGEAGVHACTRGLPRSHPANIILRRCRQHLQSPGRQLSQHWQPLPPRTALGSCTYVGYSTRMHERQATEVAPDSSPVSSLRSAAQATHTRAHTPAGSLGGAHGSASPTYQRRECSTACCNCERQISGSDIHSTVVPAGIQISMYIPLVSSARDSLSVDGTKYLCLFVPAAKRRNRHKFPIGR